ncbi:MAG: N-6 DNA methylase [Actinomycetota bacterium]|nr:N-6 DNA methylase [Actinomycetota bacterium]
MARTQNTFSTVRTEGSLLPADFLQRLLTPKSDIEGLRSEDYHLVGRERIDDAASRSWLRLVGAWAAFRAQLQRLSADDTATTITREKWLYVLFSELNYGRLEAAKGITAEGKPYPVSHLAGSVPLHLVGANIDLDKRTRGAVGAATMSPHGLVQELLNRSDDYLWGVVSNGRVLRVLRDNAAMTRQAFVEFDLEAMFEGQEYHDFVLLWMLLHQSRFEGERPAECWIEKWVATSRSQGTRALDALRGGVEAAITALGTGLVSHRGNVALKAALRDGDLDKHDLYRQVLRIVYRLIFLFATEDRELVFSPGATREAKDRYLKYYSVSRLRRLAERRRGDGHSDLWQQLLLTFELFATGDGEDSLGVPFMGGLFRDSDPLLADSQVSNLHLLEAVRALTTVSDGQTRRRVDYRNLGAEELGSVYESLLEQHPNLDLQTGSFELGTAAGSERKTTGSYYTPSSLISLLLDSALEPVLGERVQTARKEGRDVEEAILDLKVCDPACGSGHFLIAAAHRIARELAKVRTGDDEPSPSAQRHALRDVVSRCIYGVDINPMAVELAKVGLWLEAIEPGKPLTFLDHHLKQGNSLLGATPALIKGGIPDSAFDQIEGDDRKVASSYKARNKVARGGQLDLLAAEEPADYSASLADQLARIDVMSDETPDQLAAKERLFAKFTSSREFSTTSLVADAYCAAFVWPATADAPRPITQGVFEGLCDGTALLGAEIVGTVSQLAQTYEWFHWHLQFPDVFSSSTPATDGSSTGWIGGFDCMLGNPPWERIKLQEKEFFAARSPEIANAANAAKRKALIARLVEEHPVLAAEFAEAKRRAEGESHVVRSSGRYPLCGRGDVNTYTIFAELNRQLVASTGRTGCIVPTGIATDDTTKYFFRDTMESGALVSLIGFENEEFIFPGVHHATKFCLLTMSGAARRDTIAEFSFFLRQPAQTADPERRFELSVEDIVLINPNTRTCPIFRTRRDAEITKGVYRRVPVLIDEEVGDEGNPWGVRFFTVFHMANDSGLFRSHEELEEEGFELQGNIFLRGASRYLPLYEAKMMHQFDHRFGTYDGQTEAQANQGKLPELTPEQHADPDFAALPRYWVEESEVEKRLDGIWDRAWLLGFRDVTTSVSRRTLIAAFLPRLAFGHKLPLVMPAGNASIAACLLACMDSFSVDYIARQKTGGISMTYFVLKQLAVPEASAFDERPRWAASSIVDWVRPRVLELVYTSHDMAPFARDVGYDGDPFVWDEDRRFELRSELDAAFFHLYGIQRDDVDYIMDTFWIVKADDEKRFGDYRTKRRILELFDEYAGDSHG